MADYWRYGDNRGPAPPAPLPGSAAGHPNSSAPPLKRHRPDYPEKGADWRYGDRPGAALPPPADLKRPRADYDGPGGRDPPPYYPPRDDDRHGFRVVRDNEPIGASYDRYLRSGGGPGMEHGRPGSGGFPVDERPGMMGGRPEPLPLPRDASSTLYVEGLPPSCTRREVSHIFRPFVGYREVRLVTKEGKNKDGNPHVLCFVDFTGPAHAAVALDALQVLFNFMLEQTYRQTCG
ncbi:hypothetical protein LUZ60_011824 [Juncus effusus]|nr:hypothetical protein LUZ60_011824 [Juncus effusus]